jgi:uncharacterized membrane protein YfcA
MLDQATSIVSPQAYLAGALAVTCLGLSKGGFIGFGLVATPLLALAIPPVQAVAILLPVMLLQDLISAWAYRRDWDSRNLIATLPGAMLGVGVAWMVATLLQENYVRCGVGLVGLAFALNHWLGRMPANSAERPPLSTGMFWGMVSGFTGTLANAGGPPFLVYILPQQLEKLTFVGTMAIFFAVLNAAKMLPVSALEQFSGRNLVISATLLPLAVAANFAGIWLVRKLPACSFYKISYVLLSCVSVALIWQSISACL